MLKFLVDHNVPKSVGNFLRKNKHDVKLVKHVNPEMSDLEALDLAKRESRIMGLKRILPKLKSGFGVVVLQ